MVRKGQHRMNGLWHNRKPSQNGGLQGEGFNCPPVNCINFRGWRTKSLQ
jgi:hypothetical protein